MALFATIVPIAVVLASGCRSEPPPIHDGPVVLITIDTLRADAVGAVGGIEGLTPNLDALAIESQWAHRAVSASSWTVPSMASIFTGLQPWAHGSLHGEQYRLAESLRTLPEALQEAGYRTAAFRSNRWLTHKNGYGQGFDEFYALGQRKRAAARLRALDGTRQFLWIHVLPPHAPYVKRDDLAAVLSSLDAPDGTPLSMPALDTLPQQVRPLDLEPWYDPDVTLTSEDRERFWAMYLINVAYADRIVGQLLDALRQSGQWDRTLLAVTSDHGEEFGENGQIVHGGSLHRVLIEVPLLIKLPTGFRRLQPEVGAANSRLYSTLLEAVGAEPTPGALPSLFTSPDLPALSELYQGNGTNQFSLADGDSQLLWTSRFGPTEPEYFQARLAGMGGDAPPTSEDPAHLWARQRQAFESVPPLAGLEAAPKIDRFRWLDGGLVEPAGSGRLEVWNLHSAWLASGPDVPPEQRFGPVRPELSPRERDELRALGYVVPE